MARIAEIRNILSSGELERLVAFEEDDFLEAKGPRPYDLTTPKGRFELAKDVSAFANAGGGYLIIGVQHERMPTRSVEKIAALDLIERDSLDVDAVFGVINTHV